MSAMLVDFILILQKQQCTCFSTFELKLVIQPASPRIIVIYNNMLRADTMLGQIWARGLLLASLRETAMGLLLLWKWFAG